LTRFSFSAYDRYGVVANPASGQAQFQREGDMEKAKTFIDKGLEKFPDSGMLKEVLKQYEEKMKKN